MHLTIVQRECVEALETYPHITLRTTSDHLVIETTSLTRMVMYRDLNSAWLLRFLIDHDGEIEKYATEQMWAVIKNRKQLIKGGLT